jgi:NCS1 family nucleobase:cation symporter-1
LGGTVALADFGLAPLLACAAIAMGAVGGGALVALFTVRSQLSGAAPLVQSRAAFGWCGAWGPTLAVLPLAALWFGADVALVAALGSDGGPVVQFLGGAAAVLVPLLALALPAKRWLGALAWVAAGAALAGLLAPLLVTGPLQFVDIAPAASTQTPGALLTVASLTLAYTLLWAPLAGAWGRRLPAEVPARRVFAVAFASHAAAVFLGGALGMLLTRLAGGQDSDGGIVGPLGLSLPPLPATSALSLVLLAVACNVLLARGAAGAARSLPLEVRRLILGAVVVVAGALLGVRGAGAFSDRWLNLTLALSLWAPPWCGVMLVDILWVHRGGWKRAVLVDWRRWVGWGVVAWAGGMLAAWPFVSQPDLWQGAWGVAHPHAGDLSPVIGAATAALVYAAFGHVAHPADGISGLGLLRRAAWLGERLPIPVRRWARALEAWSPSGARRAQLWSAGRGWLAAAVKRATRPAPPEPEAKPVPLQVEDLESTQRRKAAEG